MRRNLVAVMTVCSLMWAVTGVSVLAIVYHEHHHHHEAEVHDHDDAFDLVLHCHDNGGSPHHDHELSAQLTASRTQWSADGYTVLSKSRDLDDAEVGQAGDSTEGRSEESDHGPPAYLMHCVLLT